MPDSGAPSTLIAIPAEPHLIGPFLRDLRKRMGKYQGDLVDAGVGNPGTLWGLEAGHKMPQFTTVTAYLAALGFSLAATRDDGTVIPDVPPKMPRYRQTKGVKPRGPQKPRPRRTPERDRPSNRPNSTGRCLNCFNIHPEGQVFC